MRWSVWLFLLVNLLLCPAIAEEEWSHDDLRLIVKNITREANTAPEQLFSRLESYIEHSKTRGWTDIEVLAFIQLATTHAMLHQFDEAQTIVDKYQPIAEQLKDAQSLLHISSVRLTLFDARNDADNAARLRQQYEAQALASGDPETIGYMYTEVAQSLQIFDDLRQSLLYLQKSLALFEELDHRNGKAQALSSIGSLYAALGDHQHAIPYNTRALVLAEQIGNTFDLSILYYNLGNSYYRLQQLSQAKKLLTKALNLSTELKDDIGIAYVHRYLGLVAAEQLADEDAQRHFFAALNIFERFDDKTMLLATSLDLAKVQGNLGQLDDAINRLAPLAEIADSQNYKDHTVNYYELLYRLEKKRKNYAAALMALERAKKEKLAIHNKEKEHSLQELMVKFDANQKEAENKLLQQQNELKELRLSEKESQQTILLLAFSIVIIAGVLSILFLLRQLQHRNRFKIMALRDELTGAPNRRAILAHGKKMFIQCQEESTGLTIAMLDIDHFKQFNDTYGHDIGDKVLKAFNEACRESIRSHDQYGRFGGEEWMLVLQDAQEKHIAGIFKRLKAHLNKVAIDGVTPDTQVTFSLGGAQLQDSDKSLKQLIKRADVNLYKAKAAGRNQYMICNNANEQESETP